MAKDNFAGEQNWTSPQRRPKGEGQDGPSHKTKDVSADAERQDENSIDPRRLATPDPGEVASAKPGEPRLVEEHACSQGLQAWELAALRQAASWAPGKTVSAEQFGQALAKLRGRACGSGRI